MIKIRECRLDDRKEVNEISRLTWEGYDYLSKVFDEWIKDGNFYVATDDEKVIGTAKITFLPEKTGWLEGLRVHPEWRGRGIGRKMNDFTLKLARYMKKSGRIDSIEFATYFLNQESLHMTKKVGFKVVKRFFVLYRKKEGPEVKPKEIKLSLDDLKEYKSYIPVGWQFVKKTIDGFKNLKKRSKAYSTGKFKFYQAGYEETFILLDGSERAIKDYIPHLNFLTSEADAYDIMFPEEWKEKIHLFTNNGFSLWDEPEEPNIMVLRDFG